MRNSDDIDIDAKASVRILIVEDDPRDADLSTRELQRAGIAFEVRVVDTRKDMLRELSAFKPDIILSDYAMPQFTGMDALEIRNKHNPNLPFVVVTASINEETAVECIKRGADDYVTKTHLIALPHAVRSTLEKKKLERAEQEAKQKTRLAAQQWRTTFDAMQDAVALLDPDLHIQRCNTVMRDLIGKPWKEIIGQEHCQLIYSRSTPPPECPAVLARESLHRQTWQTAMGERWFDIEADPVLDESGRLMGLVQIITDITERRQLEERQALLSRVIVALNQAKEWRELLHNLLVEIKNFSGFDAIGLRLKQGEDFPYFEHSGFSEGFVERERHLCARDEQGDILSHAMRQPVMERMCGNVIGGRTDPSLPFFTENGSFWTNSTTNLLSEQADADCLLSNRSFCHTAGYESVALIPLHAHGEIIGLLQLNDRRPGRFTGEMIHFFEEIGNSIGIAFTRRQAHEEAEEARVRLETALRSSKVGLWDWYPPTGEVHFSPEWKAQIGYREDELDWTYKEWENRIHPDDRNRTITALRDYLEERASVYEVEFRLQHKDGDYRWIFAKGEAIRNKEGEAVRMLGCHLDVTARKQAEEAILEERNRAQRYLDIAGVILVAIDRDGIITMINRKGCEVLGYPQDQIVGRNWFEHFLVPAERESVQSVHQLLLQGNAGQAEYYENKILTHDGEERLIAWHNVPLCDKEGRATGHLSSGEDITESKKLQNKLIQAQKLEAIATLAGGIAHDFNNILSAILGFAELVQNELPTNSSAIEYIKEVLTAGRRAKDLVGHILAFSRQVEHDRIPTAPHLIVKEAMGLLKSTLPANIEIRMDAVSIGMVMADPTRIYQVIINLCTNAYDAMRDKGGILEVGVHKVTLGKSDRNLRSDLLPGEYACLSVSDTGIGMTPEVMANIFDPYFTTKAESGGTGLGLALVHGIVRDYQGAIKAYSEPGKGSIFRVYLPILASSPDVEESAAEHPLPIGTEQILFVDDEVVLAKLGKQMIETLGYRVVACSRADEALKLFRNKPRAFDLLITDMTMPGMSGVELSMEMMRLRPDLPVILCTGFSYSVSKDKAKKAGIREFVMKPLIRRDLAIIIHKILHNPG